MPCAMQRITMPKPGGLALALAPVWTMIRPFSSVFVAIILARAALIRCILARWAAFSSASDFGASVILSVSLTTGAAQRHLARCRCPCQTGEKGMRAGSQPRKRSRPRDRDRRGPESHWPNDREGRDRQTRRKPGDLPSPTRHCEPGGVPRGSGRLRPPGRPSRLCPDGQITPGRMGAPPGGAPLARRTIELLVCVTCRRGQEVAEGGTRPGAALHDALDGTLPRASLTRWNACRTATRLHVAMRCAGRDAGPMSTETSHEVAHPDLLREARRATATDDGVIPWRERPEHFKRNCIARRSPRPPIPNEDKP